jgi:hypothetical protein
MSDLRTFKDIEGCLWFEVGPGLVRLGIDGRGRVETEAEHARNPRYARPLAALADMYGPLEEVSDVE